MPSEFDFDLIIVGTGSGNAVPDEDLSDWRIAVVEAGVFGGTCLNRGCIPSKMFVYTADVAEAVHTAGRYGLQATLEDADWAAIRDRVFARIDPIATGGRAYRSGLPNTTLFEGMARGAAHPPGTGPSPASAWSWRRARVRAFPTSTASTTSTTSPPTR